MTTELEVQVKMRRMYQAHSADATHSYQPYLFILDAFYTCMWILCNYFLFIRLLMLPSYHPRDATESHNFLDFLLQVG